MTGASWAAAPSGGSELKGAACYILRVKGLDNSHWVAECSDGTTYRSGDTQPDLHEDIKEWVAAAACCPPERVAYWKARARLGLNILRARKGL